MKLLLVFCLLGLGSGALYAGLGLSLVLTYRGAGLVNLAVGGIAVLGGYVFYGLRTGGYLFLPPIPFAGARLALGGHWTTGPALILALAVCALTGILLDGIVFRRLRRASPLAKLIATLGLLLTLQAIIQLRFGTNGQSEPAVLPRGPVNVFGTPIPGDRLLLTGIVLVLAAVLAIVYRRTRFGVATRAAQESEKIAVFYGLSPSALSMSNTVLASVVAGGIGILSASMGQLDSIAIPLAVIPALAAALIAKFSSFGTVAIAGIAMGFVYSAVSWLETLSWFPTSGGTAIQGVGDVVIFLIIAGVAARRGGALPERGTVFEKRLPAAPAPRKIIRPGLILCLVVAAGLIFLPAEYRGGLINSEIGVLMCLALVVITGFVGQVSLLQVGLAGVTGLVLTKLGVHSGIGFPFGPLIGIAAATVVGVAAGIPSLRARGVVLAVVTLAAAVALSNFWFANSSFGFNPLGEEVASPTLLGFRLGPTAAFPIGTAGAPTATFGFLCLAFVAAGALTVAALRRGELGQRMLAVRSNERAAAAAGVSVRQTKIVAYALASVLSGVAGMLYAYNYGTATSDQFTVTIALSFVAFAYIGGITTVRGAMLAGLGVTGGLIGVAIDQGLGVPGQYQLIFGGLILMVTVVQLPEGLASAPSLLSAIGPHTLGRRVLNQRFKMRS